MKERKLLPPSQTTIIITLNDRENDEFIRLIIEGRIGK